MTFYSPANRFTDKLPTSSTTTGTFIFNFSAHRQDFNLNSEKRYERHFDSVRNLQTENRFRGLRWFLERIQYLLFSISSIPVLRDATANLRRLQTARIRWFSLQPAQKPVTVRGEYSRRLFSRFVGLQAIFPELRSVTANDRTVCQNESGMRVSWDVDIEPREKKARGMR